MRSPTVVSIKKVKNWLFAALTVYLLAALALLVSADTAALATQDVSVGAVAMFVGVVTIAFGLRCTRWCLLARQATATVRFRDLLKIYIGGFPMVLTPGRVGEIWRAWVLASCWNIRYRRGLALVLADRLLDLTALLLFVALGVFTEGVLRYPAIFALALLTPLLLLAASPRWSILCIKLLWAAAGKKYPRLAASLVSMCRRVAAVFHTALFFPAITLSVLAWGVEAFAISLLVGALGGALALNAAMTALGLSNIAGVLTFTPAGIGGQEAAMTYLLVNHGNTVEIALTATLIAKIGTVFYAALVGFPFFLKLSRR